MGDRLGIQVAVDILHFFFFLSKGVVNMCQSFLHNDLPMNKKFKHIWLTLTSRWAVLESTRLPLGNTLYIYLPVLGPSC